MVLRYSYIQHVEITLLYCAGDLTTKLHETPHLEILIKAQTYVIFSQTKIKAIIIIIKCKFRECDVDIHNFKKNLFRVLYKTYLHKTPILIGLRVEFVGEGYTVYRKHYDKNTF